jgi:NADPH-dependent 2,4-dienoyl-CoA reductase/sulfur reductase-like enzyme
VATSQLAPSDIAYSLRKLFRNEDNVDVKLADVAAIDPISRTVTARDGESWSADALVLAAGAPKLLPHPRSRAPQPAPVHARPGDAAALAHHRPVRGR